MIDVRVIRDESGLIHGFIIKGHADFAEEGSDIVCSAVSVLAINTINALEVFCNAAPEIESADDAEGGYLRFHIEDPSEEAELLMRTLELGLVSVSEEYKTYVNVTDLKD